jgi:hypothetical protein
MWQAHTMQEMEMCIDMQLTVPGKHHSSMTGHEQSYFWLLRWVKGTGSYPNIYGFVSTTGSTTLQVSTDMGATRTVISDSGHGFGASSCNC